MALEADEFEVELELAAVAAAADPSGSGRGRTPLGDDERLALVLAALESTCRDLDAEGGGDGVEGSAAGVDNDAAASATLDSSLLVGRPAADNTDVGPAVAAAAGSVGAGKCSTNWDMEPDMSTTPLLSVLPLAEVALSLLPCRINDEGMMLSKEPMALPTALPITASPLASGAGMGTATRSSDESAAELALTRDGVPASARVPKKSNSYAVWGPRPRGVSVAAAGESEPPALPEEPRSSSATGSRDAFAGDGPGLK